MIPEIKEHSFYIKKTSRLGSTDTSVFFDRGLNTHILKGEVAVEKGLQCISDCTVCSRRSFSKDKGWYIAVQLRPYREQDYHELT